MSSRILLPLFLLVVSVGFAAPDPGLLFYLSADHGTTADYSGGRTPKPNFLFGVTPIADGAKGGALSCSDDQLLAYWAPGNIYAQRGTLSFFWRSRYPVGPTQFPIFRVGYADHSSWDMVWLRIDYNGHGFDAFVTDASLARTRVSVELQPFPKPQEWIHLALAWDETRGIRFYVNGKLAAVKETTAVYNAGLDQFGPHSRIISPYNVQSDYNFTRGGDIDEVRIYDRMLADDQVATLAHGAAVTGLAPLPARDLANPRWRDEWWYRYGWNRPGDPPPYLDAAATSVRKVEIHDAFDGGRWYWKALDGIRETTWPGVYNRSRLPGRNDYFQLPDWDCYVGSGKSITFSMPDEPWNHIEISGAAWGTMSLLGAEDANDAPARGVLFERPQGQEKTVHRLATPRRGQKIRFTNVQQEEPIGELTAYNVTAGREPAGSAKLSYRLGPADSPSPSLAPLRTFIDGRYAPDERATLVARPAATAAEPAAAPAAGAMPIVHVLIPCESDDPAYRLDAVDGGLDGIAIDLPAFALAPTHQGGLIPFNIQVKDPLWPLRNMFDFTFSVKPGEARTLWLDLRDRILPPGKALYLTIASASGGFGTASLAGVEIRLVFKPRADARAEHELDRFTQARDSYAMLVEEHPQHNPKLNLWNRFEGDIKDLMRVNPNHELGRAYYTIAITGELPVYQRPAPPAGVPLWAYRQVALLGQMKHFVNWYIDHRQVAFGDFGGGISDDVDLLNSWPGTALMGSDPDKIRRSDRALIEAAVKNGMFTNGLPTIQADYLHSFEEGINCLSQNMILDYGNPVLYERAMVTARGVNSLTGINAAGHRHFRTAYFNGKKMALEGVWGWSRGYSNLVLQPESLLVDFNGNPTGKKVLLELADGQIAHRHKNAKGDYEIPTAIQYTTDIGMNVSHTYFPWPLFWSAWKWTGQAKYLDPIFDGGVPAITGVNANMLDLASLRPSWGPRILAAAEDMTDPKQVSAYLQTSRGAEYRNAATDVLAWQLTGDKGYLERLYAVQIAEADTYDYINTQGSLWIDRVGVFHADLQRVRLGGIALVRNGTFPGHTVSWRFRAPANDQSVAILIPNATATSFKVIAYNLDTAPVQAAMTGWNIDPGVWEITQGIATDGGDDATSAIETHEEAFERSRSVDLTFAPRATTILTFRLKTPGTPYWARPDLGISREDIAVEPGGHALQVTVHSLGSVPAPATRVGFRDAQGRLVAPAEVGPLEAPVDLFPRTAAVRLALPDGVTADGGSVEIDPDHALEEITTLNNRVSL
jgi:hypothetical protein